MHHTVHLSVLEDCPRARGAVYQCGNRRSCLPGTQETVLHEIESWTEDFNKPPVFWLNGLAGTGKSAVAQTIVEWCDAHGQLGSSFFCSRDADDHDNPRLIFPTLAIQLAQKHSKVQSILVSLLRSNPDVVYESLSDQVEKLIVNPLKSADVSAVIIIDALDEWVDDISQSAVLSAVEYWIETIPKVKFLVTSRPKPHILASFRLPLLSHLVETFALHDIAPDLIDKDIRLFLKHELSGLAARNGLENWPTAAELDLLCGRAAGLFVYAVATVKFLNRKHTLLGEQYTIIARSPGNTIHEGTVEGVHGGLSLDSMCTSILQASFRNNDVEDDAIVGSVLATVVLVTHPLPPSAIAALICLDTREVMSILGSIQSLLNLHEDPDQPIFPLPKLFSDLLTSPTRCIDKRFYISPGKFHSEIAFNCLKLMNETLEDSFSLQNHATNSEVGCLVALMYACTSWHIHLTGTREEVATLIPTLRRFLEDKFMVWSEVLGTLLGVIASPEFVMNQTITWLREVCFGLL